MSTCHGPNHGLSWCLTSPPTAPRGTQTALLLLGALSRDTAGGEGTGRGSCQVTAGPDLRCRGALRVSRPGRAGRAEPLPRGAASRICCCRQPIGATAGTARLHSFIHKKRGAGQLGSAPFPAPRPAVGARILTAIRLVAVIRAVIVLVAFPDGGDAPLVPALELVLLALLDGACRDTGPRLGQRGALPRPGGGGTPGPPRTARAKRREPPPAEGGG